MPKEIQGSPIATAALAFFLYLPALQHTASANDTFVLQADTNFITLQAENASLKDVFAELENQTGIRISFETSISEKVTFDMQQQPFLAAIGKLAPNHLVINGKSNGQLIIKELVIMGDDDTTQSGNSGFENLPTGEPAEEVESEPSLEPMLVETPTENMPTDNLPNQDQEAPSLQN